MKISIPGQEIASIRKAFGMTADAFAQVLAVHPGTVRRWESAGAEHVPIDGVAASVLAVARVRLHSTPIPNPAAVQAKGNEVEAALVAAGALVALALLIAFLTEKR